MPRLPRRMCGQAFGSWMWTVAWGAPSPKTVWVSPSTIVSRPVLMRLRMRSAILRARRLVIGRGAVGRGRP